MNTAEPNKKSTFVTVIAWILIVVTGFSTFVTALQNIMIQIMFDDLMKEEMMKSDPDAFDHMPEFFNFMFENFDLMFLAFFIANLIAFVASIGLLLRKNWGRIIIIGIMALGIVWNIGGFYFQQSMFSDIEQFQTEIFKQQQKQAEEAQENNPAVEEEECCETDPCCNKEPESEQDREKREQAFEEFEKTMGMMQKVMLWIGLLMAIGFTLIESFIIWKLCTPKVVAEFKNK
jgi:type II secretory pathway pseudopilin PulG